MHGRSGILRPITLPFLFALPLLLSLAACEGDDTVINNVPPNAIYGQVSPAVPEVRIAAWQAEERAFTFADSAGYFVLRELEPGIYRLVIDSPSGYHAEVPQVSVGPQDGVSVGVIALNDSPGILLTYSPARNAPAAIATEIVPMLHFSVPMQATSFLTQVRFEPDVAGQWLRMGSEGTDFRFRPLRSLGAGREYQVHILPGLLTTAGEPWGETFSFPIRTLPFVVSAIETSEYWNLQDFPPLPLVGETAIATVRFTMPLDRATIEEGVSSPGLDLTAQPIGTGSTKEISLAVRGVLSSGTTYRITMGPLIHDHNGDPLAAPETIFLKTQPFSIGEISRQPNLDDLPPGYSGFVYGETYNTYAVLESFVEGLSITPAGPEVEIVTVPTQVADVREIRVQLSNFRPATDYLLRLSPDLMAADGARLGQERVVAIHTQPVGVLGATITTAVPYFTGMGEVNPDDAIEFILRFNYRVDVAALPAAVEFEPPLAGEWYQLSQDFAVSNYRFYPDQPNMLPPGSIGRMRVKAGVPLVDGIVLTEDFVAEYEVLPLVIVTSFPPRGNVVPRTTSVRLSFNARMDRAAVAAAFSITRAGGAAIEGTISWTQAERYFEFRPSNLVPGDVVTARLTTAARSASGDTLETGWETDYRVGPG